MPRVVLLGDIDVYAVEDDKGSTKVELKDLDGLRIWVKGHPAVLVAREEPNTIYHQGDTLAELLQVSEEEAKGIPPNIE